MFFIMSEARWTAVENVVFLSKWSIVIKLPVRKPKILPEPSTDVDNSAPAFHSLIRRSVSLEFISKIKYILQD